MPNPNAPESASEESMTDLSSSDSVEVKDISLVDYVNVQHAVYLRKSARRKWEWKDRRLTVDLWMNSPHCWSIRQEAVRQGTNAHR